MLASGRCGRNLSWLHDRSWPDEFFAELTMGYFGTLGDLGLDDPKRPEGPDGLKNYDAESFALFHDLYQGRIAIAPNPVRVHRQDK